jgi:hypothetical protein
MACAINVGDPYKYVYTVLDASGDHVSGLTPTLKIQKASDAAWFDFSDGEFKASGWTSKTQILTEDTDAGFYYYVFTPPSSEVGAEQYIFLVDNNSPSYADHQPWTVVYEANALNKYVNGLKDNGEYEGIEKMIRVNR